MSNHGRFPGEASSDPGERKEGALAQSQGPGKTGEKATRTAGRYGDLQSAMRFPIKLQASVKSESGEQTAETQNISANGVLFQMDSDMPLGSMVDFTISLPADIVGAAADVRLDCRGRVVRNFEDGGRRGVGVVIDEYHFGRR